MKIGVCYPETPQWPKWSWVAAAIVNLGIESVHITTIDQLVAMDAECELILFSQQGAGMHPGAISKAAREPHHAAWVQWCFQLNALHAGTLKDQPRLFGPNGNANMHLNMAKAMDAVLIKERNLIDEYIELGVKAEFFDQGCPSSMPQCEHLDDPQFDVLFYGNMAWSQRAKDIDALVSEGFDVAWVGQPGDTLPPGCRPFGPRRPEDIPVMATNAAVTLAVDMRSDLSGYHSDRTWMALGMGACVARRRFPDMPDGMEDVCMVYDDAESLVANVREAVADRAMRADMGDRAREWTMANHTYEKRIEALIERFT